MSVALLDTNVLLALAWPNHQHHDETHVWFAGQGKRAWATCAFTQLGFIRLSSNPAYTTNAVSPGTAAALLQQWTRIKTHRFWPSVPADDPTVYLRAVGHQQVNDAWLVEVARRNAGRLVTLDRRISTHGPEKGLIELIEI